MRHNNLPSAMLLALSLLSAPAAGAAPPPAAPVTVEADSLELNQKTGVSLYEGNVRLQQDAMLLQADRLELHSDGKRLTQAIADGTPVHLEQTDPQTGEVTRAEALHIQYRFSSGQLELTGDAHLWRGGDKFSGNHLVYDAEARTVRASGNKEGKSRVKVILQPETGAGQ